MNLDNATNSNFLETELGIVDIFLIAGPCVIESEPVVFEVAEELKELSMKHEIKVIFKSSFMKANRTSIGGFRSIGVDKSLKILSSVKERFDLPVLTDIHEYSPFDEVSDVVDIIQTPAFLCRQTEFIEKVAQTGKIINVKKGQFLSPEEMRGVADKFVGFGNSKIMLCERGTSFGYNYLVNDFRGIQQLQKIGFPVVFDGTHSVQRPGAKGDSSGGDRCYAPGLIRAAVALGVDGIFAETHPDPDNALCDGPNMIRLNDMDKLVRSIKLFRDGYKQLMLG